MSPAPHDPSAMPLALDGRAFLADALAASATAQAEQAFADLCGLMSGGSAPDDLTARIEARGVALMDMWADLMACTGQDHEAWARDAALRAVRIYAGRLGELMSAAADRGRS